MSIIFNPTDLAENMRKYGGFIPGIRPGKRTAEYIDRILTRLTLVGALYLAAVTVLPEFLLTGFHVAEPAAASAPLDRGYFPNWFTEGMGINFYFGGTSLLIVVGVAMDTIQQIESQLVMRNYEGFMKTGPDPWPTRGWKIGHRRRGWSCWARRGPARERRRGMLSQHLGSPGDLDRRHVARGGGGRVASWGARCRGSWLPGRLVDDALMAEVVRDRLAQGGRRARGSCSTAIRGRCRRRRRWRAILRDAGRRARRRAAGRGAGGRAGPPGAAARPGRRPGRA